MDEELQRKVENLEARVHALEVAATHRFSVSPRTRQPSQPKPVKPVEERVFEFVLAHPGINRGTIMQRFQLSAKVMDSIRAKLGESGRMIVEVGTRNGRPCEMYNPLINDDEVKEGEDWT